MKSTIKVVLVLALFCGTALAEDGDMGNGGLTAATGAKEVVTNSETGDMGNGGKTCPNGQTTCLASTGDPNSIFEFARQFLASIY